MADRMRGTSLIRHEHNATGDRQPFKSHRLRHGKDHASPHPSALVPKLRLNSVWERPTPKLRFGARPTSRDIAPRRIFPIEFPGVLLLSPPKGPSMPAADLPFDTGAAVDRLLHFLSVEGITGQEEAIGRAVVDALVKGGVSRKSIRFDKANEKIPLPTQTGNLIVTLPGTRSGPRRLLMTHLDTVPLCAGAVPVRKGNRIVP